MKMRKLSQGWSGHFVWEWRWFARSKMVYFTPCHVGLEAGTYIGGYIELTVVILGLGFYIRWHPPTERRQEFIDEMHEAMASVKKQYDITEDAT